MASGSDRNKILMYILGILYSINSTVCLLKDGEIVSAVSEERFSRIKNDDAFPENAIRWTLDHERIQAEDLDAIALSTVSYQGHDEYQLIKKFSTFRIDDYVKEQTEYWRPLLFKNQSVKYLDVFRDKIDTNQFDSSYWKDYLKRGLKEDYRIALLNQYFQGKVKRIIPIDHHRSHAAYGYYSSPFRSKDCLIFTADAFGDGLNATISTVTQGKIERVFKTSQFTLARLYKFITLLLGMKPNEHEYKVMGLAPYANESIYQKPYKIFRETLQVKGLDFEYRIKPTDLYFYFREKLEGCRFDGIAAGLQLYFEEVLVEWVRNAIKKYNIRRIVFSGGAAMNIKAMGKIAAMPEVDEFHVSPAGSDESTALGAAFCYYEDQLISKGKMFAIDQKMEPLKSAYLGPDVKVEDITEALRDLSSDFLVHESPNPGQIAALLSQGYVVARCVGRCEFGPRALGNRSILADPRNPAVVSKINRQIKNRDFWMPFAPVMLDSVSDLYLTNPKKLPSPFMTLGFETSALAASHLPGALHPSDFSARPQVLTREMNPELYEILVEFQKITGVGALINTSFNLHGYPIVNTPQDAIEVMENSDLDGLFFSHALILRCSNIKKISKPGLMEPRLLTKAIIAGVR